MGKSASNSKEGLGVGSKLVERGVGWGVGLGVGSGVGLIGLTVGSKLVEKGVVWGVGLGVGAIAIGDMEGAAICNLL